MSISSKFNYRHGSALEDESVVTLSKSTKKIKKGSTAPSGSKRSSEKRSPRGVSYKEAGKLGSSIDDGMYSKISNFRNSVDDGSFVSNSRISNKSIKQKKMDSIGNFYGDKTGLEIVDLLSR